MLKVLLIGFAIAAVGGVVYGFREYKQQKERQG